MRKILLLIFIGFIIGVVAQGVISGLAEKKFSETQEELHLCQTEVNTLERRNTKQWIEKGNIEWELEQCEYDRDNFRANMWQCMKIDLEVKDGEQ